MSTATSISEKINAFKAQCAARGETIADYCRRNGLDYEAMLQVLRGRSKGRHGKAHQIFVALGLKANPEYDKFDHNKCKQFYTNHHREAGRDQ